MLFRKANNGTSIIVPFYLSIKSKGSLLKLQSLALGYKRTEHYKTLSELVIPKSLNPLGESHPLFFRVQYFRSPCNRASRLNKFFALFILLETGIRHKVNNVGCLLFATSSKRWP